MQHCKDIIKHFYGNSTKILRFYENGLGVTDDGLPYAKRAYMNPWALHQHQHQQSSSSSASSVLIGGGAHHQQHHHPSQHNSTVAAAQAANNHHHHHPASHHQHQPHASEAPYYWYTHHPLHLPPQTHGTVIAGAGAGAGVGGPALLQAAYGLAQLTTHQQPAATHPSASAASSASLQLNGNNGGVTTGAAAAVAAGGGAGSASLDDEWKNIHVMLNCILGMVDKTKRALAILQRRGGCTSPAQAGNNVNGPPHHPHHPSQQQQQQGTDAPQAAQLQEGDSREGTFKRLSGEIVAQTIRATEDRVAEVKRRAEEAVLEVKRAAVAEVQRALAVAVAESQANERLRSQRYLDSLPRQQQPQHLVQATRPGPFLRYSSSAGALTKASSAIVGEAASAAAVASPNDEADHKESSRLAGSMSSNCWNCGRPALETCGGCGIARYCGSFCQHRDWDTGGHHATCQSNGNSNARIRHNQQQKRERASSTTSSPNNSDSDSVKCGTSGRTSKSIAK
ncbi:hypothetical protein TKK_0008402 [Trichogramma kaykai]